MAYPVKCSTCAEKNSAAVGQCSTVITETKLADSIAQLFVVFAALRVRDWNPYCLPSLVLFISSCGLVIAWTFPCSSSFHLLPALLCCLYIFYDVLYLILTSLSLISPTTQFPNYCFIQLYFQLLKKIKKCSYVVF